MNLQTIPIVIAMIILVLVVVLFDWLNLLHLDSLLEETTFDDQWGNASRNIDGRAKWMGVVDYSSQDRASYSADLSPSSHLVDYTFQRSYSYKAAYSSIVACYRASYAWVAALDVLDDSWDALDAFAYSNGSGYLDGLGDLDGWGG